MMCLGSSLNVTRSTPVPVEELHTRLSISAGDNIGPSDEIDCLFQRY